MLGPERGATALRRRPRAAMTEGRDNPHGVARFVASSSRRFTSGGSIRRVSELGGVQACRGGDRRLAACGSAAAGAA